MSLLLSELRLRRLSLLVWTISVAALMLMLVAFYPQIRHDASLNDLYEGMSTSVQALLGGSDLTSPVGYLNTQAFAFFLPAVLLVYGIGRGAASVAGEEQARTLDLLLAQPLRRSSAYLQKALAVAAGVALLTFATWLPLALANGPVQFDLPQANLLAVCVQMGLFALAISLGAQAIATASGRSSLGVAIAAAYAFVSYLVYGLSQTVDWLAHLRPLTLWRWYLFGDPLRSGWDISAVVVLVLTSVVLLGLGIWAFQRRDLRS